MGYLNFFQSLSEFFLMQRMKERMEDSIFTPTSAPFNAPFSFYYPLQTVQKWFFHKKWNYLFQKIRFSIVLRPFQTSHAGSILSEEEERRAWWSWRVLKSGGRPESEALARANHSGWRPVFWIFFFEFFFLFFKAMDNLRKPRSYRREGF